MAENKQYITQAQENGSINISEDVLSAIVEHTIQEVEGNVNLVVKPGADIVDMIGKKNWGKGMKIQIAEDNSVTVDCNVTIGYGQAVINVAQAVQAAITSAIESIVGVAVTAVNVNVCGIIRQ